MRRLIGVFVLQVMAGAGAASALDASQATLPARCELPESTPLLREGNSVLHVWELPAAPVWFGETLPDTPGYVAYRNAIGTAGADLVRPVSDPPQPQNDAERELWRREHRNVALMYEGGGDVRRIQCLEAALFAFQDARYSELTRPTEFAAHILRRSVPNGAASRADDRIKVYFGASDQMFPPKRFYGLEEVEADVAAGWQHWVVLHNHPVKTLKGKAGPRGTRPEHE